MERQEKVCAGGSDPASGSEPMRCVAGEEGREIRAERGLGAVRTFVVVIS